MQRILRPVSWSKDQIESRLLLLAALFLVLQSAGLTLAPVVREQSWAVPLNWGHWAGVGLWLALFGLAHWQNRVHVPDRDPYLLPIAGLLTGWGLLTIWRLLPGFGARQAAWLFVGVGLYIAGLRLPNNLRFLRRYKYLWLSGGLALTALTLVFGVNPMGAGPRMWLGCCGMYLQPSEPLKLLLIIYLAGYLSTSGRDNLRLSPLPAALLPLLAPTVIMTGLALALLLSQRDLGTVSIFMFIYTAVLYLAVGHKRVAAVGLIFMGLAAGTGYALFEVVQVRVNAWLNPWLDPSGSSYQIVQSLLAVASGGILGRGPGLGASRLVPLAHSDFIYAALVEEAGLVGGLALLLALALLAGRGILAAMNAEDNFRRYLAAGLTAYITAQAVLIIGGNLRLLPLTGVTIPFVSYGGSSLVTALLALLLLVHVSHRSPGAGGPGISYPLYRPAPYLHLAALLLLGLAAAAVLTGWWAVYRGPTLLGRTDNARRSIADRYVLRGSLLDRDDQPLNLTTGARGQYIREYDYPPLAPILGYTHSVYGLAGLEAELDPYLRGLRGYPTAETWSSHLLYGQPPPGLDVRLSLDLDYQAHADDLLGDSTGALVLLEARSGEILAMASHPGYDPNHLESLWTGLVRDPSAPLLNRATNGLYPAGTLGAAFMLAELDARQPSLPNRSSYRLGDTDLGCALPAASGETPSWGSYVLRGCPAAAALLGQALDSQALQALYARLGWTEPPAFLLPAASRLDPAAFDQPEAAALGVGVRINPLQAALAGAAFSNAGARPAAHIVLAVDLPGAGWTPLLPGGSRVDALSDSAALKVAESLQAGEARIWEVVTAAANGPEGWVTWYLGGTILGGSEPPRVVAVAIEERNPEKALAIGRGVLLFSP